MKTLIQHILLLLAVTSVVMACTGVDDLADTSGQERTAQQQPVAFSAYVNRSTTRGGATGQLTTDGTGGTTSLQTSGFGVFGYYTGSRQYNQLSLPNFMYNQQVTYNGTSENWEYTPIKYWPNENGTNGSQNTDYLTFFAYAPYAEVDGATGCVATNPQSGIVALTRVKDSGDPLVSYYASLTPSECVDLCWADPHMNKKRPESISTKEIFNFHHALAALNVQIDADVDAVSGIHTNAVDVNTRIWVRSVTFEGFALKGQLNLYGGHWYKLDCDCDLSGDPVTICDGRRDRHEGVSATFNEPLTGLNPIVVQSTAYGDPALTAGVTNTAVNLFNDNTSATAPVYVIPSGDEMRVTIEYDVETRDEKLSSQYLADGRTHGSSIKNTLSATVTDESTNSITLTAGKKYTITLHLGMASVKADATVETWQEGDHADPKVPN